VTLDAIAMKRPDPRRVHKNLLADKGYDDHPSRITVLKYGLDAHIPQKENAKVKILRHPGRRKARRWVVERTHGWFNRRRAILIRWEKEPENYEAMLYIAAALICFQRAGVAN
jgi:transposase